MAEEGRGVTLVRKPFRGSYYYEWQVGPLVLQVARRNAASHLGVRLPRFCAWLDPFWRA